MNREKAEYQARIKSLTGRTPIYLRVECGMCDGRGWSSWEEICTNCAGEGLVNDWIFEDCGHLVESFDCEEEGCYLCENGECEEKRKPGDTLCPYCAAVRDDCRATYEGAKQAGWIDDFPQEHTPIKAIWERESEMEELWDI